MKVEVTVNTDCIDGQIENTIHLPEGGLVLITPDMKMENHIARARLVEDVYVVIFPKFGGVGCGLHPEWDYNTNLPIQVFRDGDTAEGRNKILMTHIGFVVDKTTGRMLSWELGQEPSWKPEGVSIYVWRPGSPDPFSGEDGEKFEAANCYEVSYEKFAACLDALRQVTEKFLAGSKN